MLLSILIPSLKKREKQLNQLLDLLVKQKTSDIEIVAMVDSGELSVGTKRQQLLEKANGRYISFVDDDDTVSQTYTSSILKSIRLEPDVVGICGIITTDGNNPKKFIHSLRYRTWSEDSAAYYRNPNHLNPVKKELALKAGFLDMNCGEDREYSKRLLPFLKSETMIDEIMYYYLFSKKNTETQKHLK